MPPGKLPFDQGTKVFSACPRESCHSLGTKVFEASPDSRGLGQDTFEHRASQCWPLQCDGLWQIICSPCCYCVSDALRTALTVGYNSIRRLNCFTTSEQRGCPRQLTSRRRLSGTSIVANTTDTYVLSARANSFFDRCDLGSGLQLAQVLDGHNFPPFILPQSRVFDFSRSV